MLYQRESRINCLMTVELAYQILHRLHCNIVFYMNHFLDEVQSIFVQFFKKIFKKGKIKERKKKGERN